MLAAKVVECREECKARGDAKTFLSTRSLPWKAKELQRGDIGCFAVSKVAREVKTQQALSNCVQETWAPDTLDSGLLVIKNAPMFARRLRK